MRPLFIAALSLVATSSAFAADALVVERHVRTSMKIFGPAVHQESDEKVYYSAERIRSEKSDLDGYVILDFSDGGEIMYDVNPKTRTYEKTDLAEMRKRIDESRKAMEARMAQLRGRGGAGSPFAGLMAGGPAAPSGPLSVKETTTTSRIAGYTARLVVFEQGGREVLRVWHTDKVKNPCTVPPGKRASGMEAQGVSAELITKRAELGGFELGSRLDKGKTKMEVTVKKVTRCSLPDSFFKVPAGYREAQPRRRGAIPAGPGGGVGH